MRSSTTQSSRDSLKALLDVDNEATRDGWRIHPFASFVQDLKAADGVLRKKGEEAGRVFVGTDAKRRWCCRSGSGGGIGGCGVLHKFESVHAPKKSVERYGRERQALANKS